jgi:hypothetical protein
MKNQKDTLPGLRPSLVIALLALLFILFLLNQIEDTTANFLF